MVKAAGQWGILAVKSLSRFMMGQA
jgi:hypothetical protein